MKIKAVWQAEVVVEAKPNSRGFLDDSGLALAGLQYPDISRMTTQNLT